MQSIEHERWIIVKRRDINLRTFVYYFSKKNVDKSYLLCYYIKALRVSDKKIIKLQIF